MPMRPVLIAVLAAMVVTTLSGVVMGAAGVEPAYVIIGSVILGVATLLAVALLLDWLTHH